MTITTFSLTPSWLAAKAAAALEGTPWTLAYDHYEDRTPIHGL
jgi:hypothetical protein